MLAERKGEILGKKGVLTVIWGPMFSGKTAALIEEIARSGYADKISINVKPANDNRYKEDSIVTHAGAEVKAFNVDQSNPEKILVLVKEKEDAGGRVDIIGIDEGQFFVPKEPDRLVSVVEELLRQGKDVIVAGLAVDANDEPFGAMPILVAKADKPVFRTAVCTYRSDDGEVCGEDATKTERLVDVYEQVVVGGVEIYAASCRQHHGKHPRKFIDND
ncbi:hypothetical protein A2Z22_04040 [Candidatus Woesebacteria bacterium RBG_16_34_12]|uniref:Thymidine kinase n=1 Tax=Candidatus Woesebacteria bacterium RBG_16_34_12 TaxID=1802480 RepID=A0A1F7X7G7_9BACT|nr:MAG: hypothetical protein A2Z22_04040 [Candidatus Woesebacteria bacterium RBG_16_34_12]